MGKSLKLIIISIILIFTSFAVGQNDSLIIATFNCNFLTRPKVHMKYGLPFHESDFSDSQRQEWEQPGYRDQKFNEAAKAVADVIYMINADVIALTEVGDEQDVEELKTEVSSLGLNYQYMAVGESADTYTQQNIALFSKYPLSSIMRQIQGREYYIPEPDDPETEEHTGVSKGMRVTVSCFGKEFILYVLHLQSEMGGFDRDAKRIAQASIVRRSYLPELINKKLIVVAGDLNDHRGEPTLLHIRGLNDIYEDLIQTGHKDFFPQLDSRWTYQFEGIYYQLDHILISFSVKEICKQNGINAYTIDHNNELASDHRPFVLILHMQ